MVDGDGNIQLNWNGIKEWLLGDEVKQDVNVLKALVKTQLYRPLFFKHDDYEHFTSDASKYWCETQKSFNDHNGVLHLVKWEKDGDDGEKWGDLDPSGSGLTSDASNMEYTEQKYNKISNVISYNVVVKDVPIVDGKFVYNDVEFYVVKDKDNNPTSVYFNEFQKEMEQYTQKIEIEDNKFKIQIKFIDPRGQLAVKDVECELIDGGTKVKLNGHEQEVHDGMFNVDGVWYVLNNEENIVKFFKVDDSLLRKLVVSQDGHVMFDRWSLDMEFGGNGGSSATVDITRHYDMPVVDVLVKEWCEYDN